MFLDIFENIKFFSLLAFHPHMYNVFGLQKYRFLKAMLRVYIWENVDSSFSFKQTKMEAFRYDDVIHHTAHVLQGMLLYLRGFSIYVWMGDSNSNILCMDMTKTEKNNCSIFFFKDTHPHIFTYRVFESIIFKNVQIHLEEAWVSYLTVNPLK